MWPGPGRKVVITQRLVDFVHGSVLGWVGSHDDKLRPSLSWAIGARVDAANDLITTFLPDVEAEQVKSDLNQNGMVAYTVVEGISHEAYQFKGRMVEMRPSTVEERAVQDIQQSKLVSHFHMYPEIFFRGYTLYPSTAVTFRVEEAFVQTPGPGAGEKIDLGNG